MSGEPGQQEEPSIRPSAVPLAVASEELTNQLNEPLLPSHGDHQDAYDDVPPPSFRGLLFYRSIYFLSGLSSSAWGRFGIIYYNRVRHLNPGQIGVLQGISPVLGFASQLFWGYIADYFQSRKAVFVFCQACGTLLLLSLSLKIMSSFWAIFFCVAGMACFNSGGVLDAHTLDFLGEAHRGMYGSIRLWCAISWGLGAVCMGLVTEHFGSFNYNFGLFGSMMTMTLLAVVLGLPSRSKSEQELYDRINNPLDDDSEIPSSGPQFDILVKAIVRIPVLLWLVQVAVIGAGMVIVDSFLFVFLQNELQASTALCGYTVGVTVLLELPIFHFSDFLLKRLGHDGLFILSMTAYSSRVIGYTLLTPSTVYWVLLLEFSHGITFACMWIASIQYAAVVAPKEWSTTVQSVLSTAKDCVGGGLGPIIAGVVMDRFGSYVMFRGIGLAVAAVLTVHCIVYFIFKQGHDKFLESLAREREASDLVDVLNNDESQETEEEEA